MKSCKMFCYCLILNLLLAGMSTKISASELNYGPEELFLPTFGVEDPLPIITYRISMTYAEIVSVVVIEDGRIYWIDQRDVKSVGEHYDILHNQLLDGGTFKHATIDRDRITSFIQNLKQNDIFQNPGTEAAYYDHTMSHITVNTPSHRLRLVTRHEAVESSGHWFLCFDGNRLSTAGATTESLLSSQPEDYRRFRKVWDDVKSQIISLIPADQPYQTITDKTYLMQRIHAPTQTIKFPLKNIPRPRPIKDEIRQ